MFELSPTIKLHAYISEKTGLSTYEIDNFVKTIFETEKGTLYRFPYCLDWIKSADKKVCLSITITNHQTF